MLAFEIKCLRKSQNITQERLSEISGVGLRFIRDLEQGKSTVRLDKVNQVLAVFGYVVGAVPRKEHIYSDSVGDGKKNISGKKNKK